MVVATRKFKGFPYDTYECVGCFRTWTSRSKKVGHSEKACKQYRLKNGW